MGWVGVVWPIRGFLGFFYFDKTPKRCANTQSHKSGILKRRWLNLVWNNIQLNNPYVFIQLMKIFLSVWNKECSVLATHAFSSDPLLPRGCQENGFLGSPWEWVLVTPHIHQAMCTNTPRPSVVLMPGEHCRRSPGNKITLGAGFRVYQVYPPPPWSQSTYTSLITPDLAGDLL